MCFSNIYKIFHTLKPFYYFELEYMVFFNGDGYFHEYVEICDNYPDELCLGLGKDVCQFKFNDSTKRFEKF